MNLLICRAYSAIGVADRSWPESRGGIATKETTITCITI